MTTIRLAAPLLLLGALSSIARAQCPFSGIVTTAFGSGAGFLSAPTLTVGIDTSNCLLALNATAPTCCNTFFTQQYLAVGLSDIPGGFPLPAPPFLDNSLLYVLPFDILGAFPAGSYVIQLPPDPSLVGATVFLQGIPSFFTTIGMTTDLGTTNAVQLTFL